MTIHGNTEQEAFWAGDFGTEYIDRNTLNPDSFASRLSLWSKVLRHVPIAPKSILELGANIGINLHALHALLPKAALTGIEINPSAAAILRKWGGTEVIETSILDYSPDRTWDMVFTSGVLIHINPAALMTVYSLMAKVTARYVCMIEYYNPSPVTIPYRGEQDKLFKREFAGEFMDTFPAYILRDYGFIYHRDPVFPVDDLTWFILEKM
jgi:spore coat polysaccharide biosynthesis protein SpsF